MVDQIVYQYHKRYIKHPGAYLIWDTPEGWKLTGNRPQRQRTNTQCPIVGWTDSHRWEAMLLNTQGLIKLQQNRIITHISHIQAPEISLLKLQSLCLLD